MAYTMIQLRLIQINATLVMGGDRTIEEVREDIRQGVREEIQRRLDAVILNNIITPEEV